MNGSARSSASLVWHHQRLVWWVFVVNLVLAFLGSLPARALLSGVLDRSLASARLVTGFDMPLFALLFEQPEMPARAIVPGAIAPAIIFVIFLLFIDGGVFATFLEDRKQSRAEFFENSGLFFWRMLRLALYSLLPFALLAAGHGAIHHWADKLASDAPQERLGFTVDAIGIVLITILALFVRMWFDLTQARTVRDNERSLLRLLSHEFRNAFFCRKLFVKYVAIAIFAIAAVVIGGGIWLFIPHAATGLSLLVLEAVTTTQIAARLWMKAASARWVALLPSEVVPLAMPEAQVPTSGTSLPDSQYSE